MSGQTDYSKGDRPRPFNRKTWDENWNRIFGGPCKHPRQIRVIRFHLPCWQCLICGTLTEIRSESSFQEKKHDDCSLPYPGKRDVQEDI